MTKEEFKAKVSMAYDGREKWEQFLERVWQLHLQGMPHWISVEDELPPLEIVSESWETSDDVLVYTLSGDMLVSRYEFSKLTKEHYWIFSDHDYIVTHWMPLPLPPEKLSSLERTGKNWKE